MFVDTAAIIIEGGKGGDGAVSFRREKYVPAGGPDGGDGGKGGDIYFVADSNLSTLADFKYKRKFLGNNGDNGGKKKRFGKHGEDITIKVPIGTLIKESITGRIIADISGETPVRIAKGGRGGWGNQHFATPTRQAPKFSKPGLLGERFEAVLELKLLADVGLVGFPNVGKSTLISIVSEAKPKIANYHFTTLIPNLGVTEVGDKSFVIADIPGIIEGASEGIGLGHEFLRHIERCRLIVHIVDVSGVEGRDPKEDFEIIIKELKNFSQELAELPQIIVGGKTDIADEANILEFEEYIKGKNLPYFSISAVTSDGVKELMGYIAAQLDKLPPIKAYKAEELSADDLLELQGDFTGFTIVKDEEEAVGEGEVVYVVEAPWLARVLSHVDLDDYSSLQYFQRVLSKSGIIDELKKKGVEDGDTVRIFDFEFEFYG